MSELQTQTQTQALTQAQKDAMKAHAQQWIDTGFSSAETNRTVVEPIITDFYQRVGKDAPAFIYAQSPVAALFIANLLKTGTSEWSGVSDDVMAGVRASVSDSLWSSITAGIDVSNRDGVWYGVSDSVTDNVRDEISGIRDSIWSSADFSINSISTDVRKEVWRGTWFNVMKRVSTSVWFNVMKSVDSVRDSVSDSVISELQFFYGSHDGDWLAYYNYFSKYVENDIYTDEQKRRLQQWIDLNASCGWWYPFSGVCIVSARPEYTLVDEAGRLHSSSSPAIRYRDGFEICAENGVRRVCRHNK